MTARRVAEGIAANIVSFAGTTGIQLLSVPILVHIWGLSQYGIWIILTTIPTYLMLGNFGLLIVASNDMAAQIAAGHSDRARRIYSTAVASIGTIVALLLTVCVGTALLLPADAIPAAHHVAPLEMRIAVVALVIYGVLAIISELAMVPFRATGQYARGIYTTSVIALLERCSVLVFATLGFHMAAIAMASVRVAGVAYMFSRSMGTNPELRPRLSDATIADARRMAKLGFGMILFTLGMAINLQGPILVVGALLPPAVVALFSATRTLTRFGLQATSVISSSVMAEFAIASGSGDELKQKRLFSFNVVTGFILLVGAFVGLLIFGPQLTYLWLVKTARPEFLFVALIAAGTVLQGFWIITANLLMASNRQYTFTPTLCFVGIMMAIVGGLASISWGIIGMAAAIILAELFMCIWIYRKAARLGIGRLSDAPFQALESFREWQARRAAARQAKG